MKIATIFQSLLLILPVMAAPAPYAEPEGALEGRTYHDMQPHCKYGQEFNKYDHKCECPKNKPRFWDYGCHHCQKYEVESHGHCCPKDRPFFGEMVIATNAMTTTSSLTATAVRRTSRSGGTVTATNAMTTTWSLTGTAAPRTSRSGGTVTATNAMTTTWSPTGTAALNTGTGTTTSTSVSRTILSGRKNQRVLSRETQTKKSGEKVDYLYYFNLPIPTFLSMTFFS